MPLGFDAEMCAGFRKGDFDLPTANEECNDVSRRLGSVRTEEVATHADAVHKLEWYALRWKIETFFRTLKTGCLIEELRLATAERLANSIALCCVVAWRVSWLAMLSRDAPATDPAAVFTENERHLLDQATPDRKRQVLRDLQFYVRAVARLGGYLDRASDAPPGTTVIWRGFSRLADLVEGARLATPPDTCG